MANILIGISGSIAAYKSVLYIRELCKLGHKCKVIISQGGLNFVTPQLISALGCEVYTDQELNLTDPEQAMLHINLAKWAERFVIAPASANLLAKLAHGHAADLLTEVALAYGDQTIYIAPAMNRQMWQNARTQTNLNLMKEYGMIIWEPASGLQACGDIGTGRMLEAAQLLELTLNTLLNSQPLNGQTLVITLGATMEAIDPVRYISNHSSGKMGIALINAALTRGAKVVAIHGQISQKLPEHPHLQVVKATSALAMLVASQEHAPNASVFIACAAVCDYRVFEPKTQKIKKHAERITLELIKNPDIVATIKSQYPQLIVVGFAAETTNVNAYAEQKMLTKNLDMLIANDVSNGQVFCQDHTQISILRRNHSSTDLPPMSKTEAANQIFSSLQELLPCN